MSFLKKFLVIVLLIVVGTALLGGYAGYRWSQRPIALRAATLDVTVIPHSSLRGVALQLNRGGVAVNRYLFEAMTRLLGLSSALKAGNYEFETGLTPYSLLQKIARGDVNQYVVTIIEGWNFARMRAEIERSPALAHDTASMSDAAILQAIGAPQTLPEGLFFPDTYLFAKGVSDLDVYARAYRLARLRLDEAWAARAPGLPYKTPYAALIVASLIEKETGRADERAQVAGVFVNRLRAGMPLQTDPSVVYGMGDAFTGRLRTRDLRTDTPYNTYTRSGLPPTPIALPGAAALYAALHPADTTALYFVSRGDGTSIFSDTLSDHNRAVNKYQRGQ